MDRHERRKIIELREQVSLLQRAITQARILLLRSEHALMQENVKIHEIMIYIVIAKTQNGERRKEILEDLQDVLSEMEINREFLRMEREIMEMNLMECRKRYLRTTERYLKAREA